MEAFRGFCWRVVSVMGGVALPIVLRGAALGAQGAPAPPPSPVVSPGDSALRGALIGAGSTRYALTAYRDADEIPVGRLTDEIRVDTVQGVVLLRRVQRLQRGTTTLIDSTVTEQITLAPRAHYSQQPTRRIRLEFSGRRVRGSIGPHDVPPVPIDTMLPASVFDSGNWDLFLRALPLEKGYAARFPVYDTDAGVHEYHIAVTGSSSVQGEEAHVVVFTLAKGRESVVWIGKQSHALLQMETMLGPTTLLRQVRLP